MDGKASDVVIGIDFGTTYSGVSWAYPGRNEIRVIRNWPSPTSRQPNSDKVPSSLSYSAGKVQRWGYGNKGKDDTFHWIKILLEPGHKYHQSVEPVAMSNRLLNVVNKSAVEVVADYLKLIWEYTLEDIRQEIGEGWRRDYKIKVVLTVPAMWTHVAKENTKKAAQMAGMPEDITMITEPEAAALSVLRDKADDGTVKAGDTIVLCDAGGGTVDLISYSVDSLKPLKIKEAARGDGALCGSVYLDMAFERYIETLIGKDQYRQLSKPAQRSMMAEFETSVKRTFDEKTDQIYTVDLFGVEDDEMNGINDNTVTLKRSALKSIFDGVVLEIEHLVTKQIEQVKKTNKSVKAVLLVGGFGESSYLHDRIETMCRSERIQVLRAQGAWSAICRGATMAGLDGVSGSLGRTPKVVSRIARYSYGIPHSPIFDASAHNARDKFLDPAENVWRAKDQVRWLLKAGEMVEEGQILTMNIYESMQVGFWDSGLRHFSQSILCCEDENASNRITASVSELCTVKYSIDAGTLWLEKSYRNPATKEKWRDAIFQLIIMLGRTSLDFFVCYKDEPVAYTEANYKEDFEES